MKTPLEIAVKSVEAGTAKACQSKTRMFILAIFAGAYIALGAFGSQVAAQGVPSLAIAKILSATVFPVGLMMVVIGGAELFTGNCLIMVPALKKTISPVQLLINWGIVYVGNMLGSILIAALLTYSHSYSMFNEELAITVVNTAVYKVGLNFMDAFLKGILCNILVCVAVWMSYATDSMAGKILGLFFPIMVFVVSGYEHCVANMYFIPAGIMVSNEYKIVSGDLNIISFLVKNMLPVTLGNIIGGAGLIGGGYFCTYLYKKD